MALQQVVSRLPRSASINLWLQRHVTRTIPVGEGPLRAGAREAREHLAAHAEHAVDPPLLAEATFLEFGAGSDLRHALMTAGKGVGRQIVIDVEPLARLDLVDRAGAGLIEISTIEPEVADALRAARVRAAGSTDLDEHLAAFGIEYRAPADARATGLPAGSVDCVTSTTALEHIPPADIAAILAECRRILRPGGVASFIIDLSDHCSHGDASITPYNFLRYAETAWERWFCTPLTFQNRLRHSEYVELFEASGLEVVKAEPREVTDEMRAQLRSVPLAEPFASMPEDDLVIIGSHVVLRASGG